MPSKDFRVGNALPRKELAKPGIVVFPLLAASYAVLTGVKGLKLDPMLLMRGRYSLLSSFRGSLVDEKRERVLFLLFSESVSFFFSSTTGSSFAIGLNFFGLMRNLK